MIAVPAGLMDTIGTLAGEPGRRWIASLPGLVEVLCADWGLTVDGAPMHGFVALVVPVLRGGDERCVLKVSWMDSETEHEGLALSIWDGRGVVRLLAEDPVRGALLLERLDHTRSLRGAPASEAVEVASRLLRRLAVPAPPQVRSCREFALRQADELPAENAALGGPVPARLLDAALAGARELGESAGALLLSEDLHYGNVLRGEREPWLMIDPKPISGDLEFGVLPLLWNRFSELDGERGLRERLAALVDAAELDPERTRAWTLLRAVDNWLWELNAANPRQAQVCATIAALLS